MEFLTEGHGMVPFTEEDIQEGETGGVGKIMSSALEMWKLFSSGDIRQDFGYKAPRFCREREK